MATEARWLDVREVAKKIGLHPETVRRMLRRGELPGRLLSKQGGWRVNEADLERFMRGNTEGRKEGA